MHRYLVSFHKVITDGSGHDRHVLQHRTLVWAGSAVAALYEAKARVRQDLGIADWRLRADTCEAIALADAAA